MNNLRDILVAEAKAAGLPMGKLTVGADHLDPYRMDTPGNHNRAKWLLTNMDRLGLMHRRLHVRGLHYALLGAPIPEGKGYMPMSTYPNSYAAWEWVELVAKAARWLGYVPFNAITDARNAAPLIQIREAIPPIVYKNVGAGICTEPPTLGSVTPHASLSNFERDQPYRLAFFGEKTSLTPVLQPMADYYGADLYLPAGDPSDTMVHSMAEAAAEDGRELVLFTLTDFDPSGYNMPGSIARRLQAFRDGFYPGLRYRVQPVALTHEQAVRFNLPSTPLKPGEARAADWRFGMGMEQVEIDALATLQPRVLTGLIKEAVAPFYDTTLHSRVMAADYEWRRAAQKEMAKQIDSKAIKEREVDARKRVVEMEDELEEIRDGLERAMGHIKVTTPVPPIPEANIDEAKQDKPLVTSDWDWLTQTEALLLRKKYDDGG